jgi:hypothetical protein
MNPNRNPILSFDDETRLREALAAVAATDGLRTPAHVETALRAALRSRNRRRLATRLALSGSCAAAVFLGLFLSRPVSQVRTAPVAETGQVESFVPNDVPAPLAAAPAPPVPATIRRATRPVPVRQAPSEQPEFIPVGHWQAVEPMERGTIVRVRVPKSTLSGFGFPVNPDRWNESIPADVVLAEDGSMRAIRFVSNVQ